MYHHIYPHLHHHERVKATAQRSERGGGVEWRDLGQPWDVRGVWCSGGIWTWEENVLDIQFTFILNRERQPIIILYVRGQNQKCIFSLIFLSWLGIHFPPSRSLWSAILFNCMSFIRLTQVWLVTFIFTVLGFKPSRQFQQTDFCSCWNHPSSSSFFYAADRFKSVKVIRLSIPTVGLSVCFNYVCHREQSYLFLW